jgi:hypothetical protein
MKFYVNRFYFFASGNEMPDTSFVSAAHLRKMSRLTRLVIGVAEKAAPGGKEIPFVFASRFGEWGQTLKQMRRYFQEREISPAGFGFSVHNTAPGQLSIIKNNHKTYTAISGAAHTFDAGMLEAVSMLHAEEEVLYVCAEECVPEAYRSVIDEEIPEFAIGLCMGRVQAEESAVPLTIDFGARNSVVGSDFSRAGDFARFLGSAASAFDGLHYALRQCEN